MARIKNTNRTVFNISMVNSHNLFFTLDRSNNRYGQKSNRLCKILHLPNSLGIHPMHHTSHYGRIYGHVQITGAERRKYR